jgi:hypothetical protein
MFGEEAGMRLVKSIWHRIQIGLLGCLVLPANVLGAEPVSVKTEGPLLVQEALQREIYGLAAERDKLLRAAVAADDTEQAHWLLGHVRTPAGNWQELDKGLSTTDSQRLAEYQKVRDSRQDDAAGNRALADWCQRHEMKPQERAHLLRSLQHNPGQAELRQRLGQVQVGGRWYDREEAEAAQQRFAETERLLARWRPTLAKWVVQINARDPAKKQEVIDGIREIRDVGMLPILQSLFAPHSEDHQLLVLDVCEKLPDPAATELIARQAVVSPSLTIRERATKMLKTRDQFAFVPLLISAMYAPAEVQVSVQQLPNGTTAMRRAFWREGAEHQDLIVNDVIFRQPPSSGATAVQDRERLQDAIGARAAQAQQAVAAENALAGRRNKLIVAVLSEVTGEDLPAEADAWWKWWEEQTDTFQSSKPVASGYVPQYQSVMPTSIPYIRRGSQSDSTPVRIVSVTRGTPPLPPGVRIECLAAGTPVWTEQGKVAIEKLRVGDQVLARDINTGELAYKPVLVTTVRPKKPLKLLTVGDEVFETTGGHLFWVSGEGWVRARDLKPGQVLHTAAGPVAVTKLDDGRAAETYNLVVADFGTYFVGEQKLLSHDVTSQQSTRVIVPGLQPEEP